MPESGARRALTASLDSCAEIKSAPSLSGRVTKSGRVWRKVPESDARSVGALFISEQLSSDAVGGRDSSVVRAPDS